MLVQKLRLQRGWSQEQLAELSGLSVRTIQRIEGGQTGSAESLKSLAAVFEIDFSSLNPEPTMNTTFETATSYLPNATVSTEEEFALKRVRAIKRFYLHVLRYLLITTGLAIINLISSPDSLWVKWVALGWGIGIVAHGVKTYAHFGIFGADWEKRQVEKILGRKL